MRIVNRRGLHRLGLRRRQTHRRGKLEATFLEDDTELAQMPSTGKQAFSGWGQVSATTSWRRRQLTARIIPRGATDNSSARASVSSEGTVAAASAERASIPPQRDPTLDALQGGGPGWAAPPRRRDPLRLQRRRRRQPRSGPDPPVRGGAAGPRVVGRTTCCSSPRTASAARGRPA